MKKRLLIVFCSLITVICCNKVNKKEIKYPSGNVHYHYFYNSKKLDSIYEFFDYPDRIKEITKIINDSVYYKINYEELRSDKLEGVILKKNGKHIKIGWWKLNFTGGYSDIEYFLLKDSSIINQSINYDVKGKIDTTNSLFYSINIPDTVDFNKEYQFDLKLFSRISKPLFLSIPIFSENINNSFTNIRETKTSNEFDIKELKVNHWKINHKFQKKGNNSLKGGILIRMLDSEEVSKDSLYFYEFEKILYIRKDVFVK